MSKQLLNARADRSKRVARKRRVHRGAYMLLLAACCLVSIFLLASGYESIYNRTLPFVSTLEAVNLSAFDKTYNLPKAATYSASYYGTYGKPQSLDLPSNSVRLDIVAPIQEGASWLARANTVHLLIPAPPRSGNIGIALMYCRSGFRTINSQNLPTVGQNLFVDTDQNWRYIYRVTDAQAYPDTEPYILADDGSTGKLIVDCGDQAQHLNYIIGATLLSVQGVEE